MKWSQLRKRIREGLSPELKERVDFHVAVYRGSHDSDYGRAWITVDGKQIASWSCFEQLLSPLLSNEAFRANQWWTDDYNRIAAELGVYSKKDFVSILTEFLNSDPHVLLTSKVPLARTLAIADKRIGRRKLAKYPVAEEKDPITLVFLALRRKPEERSPNNQIQPIAAKRGSG